MVRAYLDYLKELTEMDANDFAGSGDWLSAEELKGNTVTLTIESIEVVEFDNDRGKDTKLGLYFQNRDKGIAANKTNVKNLIEGLETADTDKWIGRKITAGPNQTPKGLGFVLRAVVVNPDDFNDDIPF